MALMVTRREEPGTAAAKWVIVCNFILHVETSTGWAWLLRGYQQWLYMERSLGRVWLPSGCHQWLHAKRNLGGPGCQVGKCQKCLHVAMSLSIKCVSVSNAYMWGGAWGGPAIMWLSVSSGLMRRGSWDGPGYQVGK